jgi:argininosuccinate lyase
MSYNRDLQELTPHLWRGIQDAKESVRLLSDMLASASFEKKRMAEEAGRGFSTATDLADFLVLRYDIPFRTAHSIVGRAIMKGSLDLAVLDAAAGEVGAGLSLSGRGLTQAQVDKALSVASSISIRKSPGGPAPVATKRAVEDRRKQINTDSSIVKSRLAKAVKAEQELIGIARRMVS